MGARLREGTALRARHRGAYDWPAISLERVKLTGKIWATAVSMALTGFSMWYTYCTFVESFGV